MLRFSEKFRCLKKYTKTLDAMMCSLFTKAEKMLTTILGEERYHQMYQQLVETYKTSKSTPQKVLKRFGEDVPGYQLQDYTNSVTNLVYVLDQVKGYFFLEFISPISLQFLIFSNFRQCR